MQPLDVNLIYSQKWFSLLNLNTWSRWKPLALLCQKLKNLHTSISDLYTTWNVKGNWGVYSSTEYNYIISGSSVYAEHRLKYNFLFIWKPSSKKSPVVVLLEWLMTFPFSFQIKRISIFLKMLNFSKMMHNYKWIISAINAEKERWRAIYMHQCYTW